MVSGPDFKIVFFELLDLSSNVLLGTPKVSEAFLSVRPSALAYKARSRACGV